MRYVVALCTIAIPSSWSCGSTMYYRTYCSILLFHVFRIDGFMPVRSEQYHSNHTELRHTTGDIDEW